MFANFEFFMSSFFPNAPIAIGKSEIRNQPVNGTFQGWKFHWSG